jgi:thiol:disulfide interchange protein DsbD
LFGRVGVPLVVFYPAGKGSEPIVLPELLTEKIVLDTLIK